MEIMCVTSRWKHILASVGLSIAGVPFDRVGPLERVAVYHQPEFLSEFCSKTEIGGAINKTFFTESHYNFGFACQQSLMMPVFINIMSLLPNSYAASVPILFAF